MQARYRILALITDTTAMALSLDSKGNTKPVSINGNPCMYYESAEDMKTFVQYIKDEYSINDFDDDDFALMIVNCGSNAAVAEHLHELTLKAGNNSLIRAEYALPFIAASKRKIKKNDDFTVSVLEAMYTICIDENGHAECSRSDSEAANALNLEPADFTVLFSADTSVFGRNEEILKQKDSELNELKEKYENRITELQTEHELEREELRKKATAGDIVIFVKSNYAPRIWVWQPDGMECSKDMDLSFEAAPLMQRHINGWYAFTVRSGYYTAGKPFSFMLDGGEVHDTDMTASFCYDGDICTPAFTDVQAEALPAAVVEEKPNLPAVVNDAVGKMVLIEAGSFDSFYRNIFDTHEIESFYISATPVTMQEYFDVTGIIPKAILGLYILKKKFMDIEYHTEIKNISYELEALYLFFMERFYVDNPIIDEEHRVLLQDSKPLIMPKSVLDSVDVDLRKKYSFLAQEDFMQQAILSYGLDVPITHISLYDAARFCNAKSKKEGLQQAYNIKSTDRIEYERASTGYYIPNYKEWLYAACGGKDRPEDFQYGGCGTLTEVAWYENNSGGVLHPVAKKKPDTLGLYDMHGNVQEWIVSESNRDRNGNTLIYKEAEFIGGSAYDSREACTSHASSDRNTYSLSYKDGQTGFRICKSSGGGGN